MTTAILCIFAILSIPSLFIAVRGAPNLEAPAARALCVYDVMQAVLMVENWKSGSGGPYQITPIVWRQWSKRPYPDGVFRDSWFSAEPERVAFAHAAWVVKQIDRHNYVCNAFNFGLFWNAGVKTVLTNQCTRGNYSYATRVANEYDEIRGIKGHVPRS